MHTCNGKKRYIRFLKLTLKLIFWMFFSSTESNAAMNTCVRWNKITSIINKEAIFS